MILYLKVSLYPFAKYFHTVSLFNHPNNATRQEFVNNPFTSEKMKLLKIHVLIVAWASGPQSLLHIRIIWGPSKILKSQVASYTKKSECLGVGYQRVLKIPGDSTVQSSLEATSVSSGYTTVIWSSYSSVSSPTVWRCTHRESFSPSLGHQLPAVLRNHLPFTLIFHSMCD